MNWDKHIKECEDFFNSVDLPDTMDVFNGTILNVRGFVNNHLSTVKANNGNQGYRAYMRRLWNLKEIMNGKLEKD